MDNSSNPEQPTPEGGQGEKPDTKLSRLKGDLNELIKQFGEESEKHKSLNRRLRYYLFALTGCATVLSATAAQYANLKVPLNLVVVLVTVGAGIVASIEAIRKPAQLWILERGAFHALKDLRRELEYEGSGVADTTVDLYFKRMQSILAASNEQWIAQANPPKKTP
jgi:hypothetical protein